MNCSQCGKEISAGEAACPRCGASFVAGDPQSAAPTGGAVSSASSSGLGSVLAAIGSLLCFGIIARLNFFSTAKTYHSWGPEAIGYLIGRCLGAYLLPLIGALIYYKVRRKKPSGIRRLFVISLWALGLALLSFAGEHGAAEPSSPEEIKRHVGALAKEAVGQAPASGDQTKWDGALRSYFADIKAFNEAYEKETAQLDNSALKSMYTANSFRSAKSIGQIISQMHATLDLDEKYASMQPIIDKLKKRVFATDASDSEKQDFWQGFESTASKSLEPREAAMAKGREWMQASIDLYEFVQSDEGAYSVRRGKIVFKSTGAADNFNAKMRKATELRSEFLKIQDAFRKAQSEKLGQYGLQPSDLGAPTPK